MLHSKSSQKIKSLFYRNHLPNNKYKMNLIFFHHFNLNQFFICYFANNFDQIMILIHEIPQIKSKKWFTWFHSSTILWQWQQQCNFFFLSAKSFERCQCAQNVTKRILWVHGYKWLPISKCTEHTGKPKQQTSWQTHHQFRMHFSRHTHRLNFSHFFSIMLCIKHIQWTYNYRSNYLIRMNYD